MATATKDYAVSKQVSKEVTDKIVAFARETLAEAGLELSRTSSRYGYLYKLSIEAVAVETGRNGVNLQSKEAQDFLEWPEEFDLTAEDLGNKFRAGAEEFIFSGINRRARAMPFVAVAVKDGRRVKLREGAAAAIRLGRES